jgi:hypothetical protein
MKTIASRQRAIQLLACRMGQWSANKDRRRLSQTNTGHGVHRGRTFSLGYIGISRDYAQERDQAGLGDDRALLFGGEATTARDAGDSVRSGEGVGHRHSPRSVPGSLTMHMEGHLAALDINPLMVLPSGLGVTVVDALVVLRGT